jgi:hypothetical protein
MPAPFPMGLIPALPKSPGLDKVPHTHRQQLILGFWGCQLSLGPPGAGGLGLVLFPPPHPAVVCVTVPHQPHHFLKLKGVPQPSHPSIPHSPSFLPPASTLPLPLPPFHCPFGDLASPPIVTSFSLFRHFPIYFPSACLNFSLLRSPISSPLPSSSPLHSTPIPVLPMLGTFLFHFFRKGQPLSTFKRCFLGTLSAPLGPLCQCLLGRCSAKPLGLCLLRAPASPGWPCLLASGDEICLPYS